MFEGSAAAPLELPRQEPGMRDARQASARLICLVRDQGLPVVGAGAELPVASVADGLAARGAPGLLRVGAGGGARCLSDRGGDPEQRGSRHASVLAADDDGAATLCVLRGRVFVAQSGARDLRG